MDGPDVALVAAPRRRPRRHLRVRRPTRSSPADIARARSTSCSTASTSTRGSPGAGGTNAARARHRPPTRRSLVTVCRLFPEKGRPSDQAVADVRDEFPDVRLLIVGTDVTRRLSSPPSSTRSSPSSTSDGHVRLLGRRRDIDGADGRRRRVRHAVIEEPFGLVFAEAMAMSMPVVGLDDGGTPEVVEHGRSGLLSAPGDVDALADQPRDPARAIRRCGPRWARTVGRGSSERFTTERMAAEVGRAVPAGSVALEPIGSVQRRGSRHAVLATHWTSRRSGAPRPGRLRRHPRRRVQGHAARAATDLLEEYERLTTSRRDVRGRRHRSAATSTASPARQSRFVYDELADARHRRPGPRTCGPTSSTRCGRR